MINNALFMFAAIPAILYNRGGTLNRLYKNCVELGMSLQDLSKVLRIDPLLKTTSGNETDGLVEVFEYENNEPEKYIMVFINGKLNKWYTELRRSLED